MKEILSTDRLTLSEWELKDAEFLVKLVNTPEWLEHIGDRNIHSIEDAKAYIKKLQQPYRSYGHGFYAVRLKKGKGLIGLCGIIKRPGLDDPDLGFALMPDFVGEGYMYEISKAMLRHAYVRLGLSRIVAITSKKNQRGINLLERLGMKYEKDIQLPNDPELLKLYAIEQGGR